MACWSGPEQLYGYPCSLLKLWTNNRRKLKDCNKDQYCTISLMSHVSKFVQIPLPHLIKSMYYERVSVLKLVTRFFSKNIIRYVLLETKNVHFKITSKHISQIYNTDIHLSGLWNHTVYYRYITFYLYGTEHYSRGHQLCSHSIDIIDRLETILIHLHLSRFRLFCDRRSVSQSVLVSGPHLGPMTRFLLLSDICGLHVLGRPGLPYKRTVL
jgi:hypothetical protein